MLQPVASEPHISLIIPAHNESSRLPRTLQREYDAFRAAYGENFEILVICNGCTDDTAAVIRAMHLPLVHVAEIGAAIGKGGAVLEGFSLARGTRLIFADADGSTSPSSLLAMVDGLTRHDVVIGSRRHPASRITVAQPWPRQILGGIFALTVQALFSLGVRDTQCGAKAFRRAVARQLTGQVLERRWAFDVELLLRARQAGFRLAEYPVEWADCEGSKLRVGPAALQVLGSLWRLRMDTPLSTVGVPRLEGQAEL